MAVGALAPTPTRSRPGATLHEDRHNRSQWNSPELAWAAAGPMNAAGDGVPVAVPVAATIARPGSASSRHGQAGGDYQPLGARGQPLSPGPSESPSPALRNSSSGSSLSRSQVMSMP